MPFSVTGYVLEAPRVGSSNNPFTLTPADYVSDPSAYNTAYPEAETNSRTDYMVMVLTDGKLISATFGWTKNEGLVALGPSVQRFDYDSKHQRFFPLPGGLPVAVGTIKSTANTTRLQVPIPALGLTAVAPIRLSLGTTGGSGTTQTISIVEVDADFTPDPGPPIGTTELSLATGNLNWNNTPVTGDLTVFLGETVQFQQQSLFTYTTSNGDIGVVGNTPAPGALALLLNPIPGDTQYPLIRIGYGTYLLSVEVPDEGAFTVPPSGTVQWALTTGRLNFNPTDIANNVGDNVYYDGILCGANITVPIQSGLGTINLSGDTSPQPTPISPIPPEGGDIIFFVPGVVQFESAVSTLVALFDPVGKQGEVQYDPTTGQFILSLADRLAYGGLPISMATGDIPVDHGITLRLFRTPVDLAGTDPTLKDVSSVYFTTGATLQAPITQTPFIMLPCTPLVGAAYPQTVYVTQGTGTFPPGNLPNLSEPNPPSGVGYTINYDKGQLQYSYRNNDQLITLSQATPIAVLPNPLVVTDATRSFALETGVGTNVFNPFTETPPGSGVFTSSGSLGGLLDFTAGQFTFTQISGQNIAEGTDGSFDVTGLIFSDPLLASEGVQQGDYLAILTGPDAGIRTITNVTGDQLTVDLPGTSDATNEQYEVHTSKEILADRYWEELELVDPNTKVERIRSLGNITNSPRLQIPVSYINVVRFRFGNNTTGTFSTSVVQQPDDTHFTSPSSLAQGTVEISIATGDLNFSAADVTTGSTIYWVRRLTQGTDYTITPELGNINFTDRFLSLEEALTTYTTQAAPTTLIVEPATFLVRKEIAQPHPTPTSTVFFNPLGRQLATNPPVQVWRGGRPQVIGTQCTVNYTNSSVTFLSDTQLTNALPHGATVNPNENIYVDYYVYGAIGGEKTINVLQFPMNLAQVSTVNPDNSLSAGITAGYTSFVVPGNYASDFPPNFLFRVETEQVYQIGTSSYNPTTGLTTVTLVAGQTFTDSYINPTLYVASGPTRTVAAFPYPAYFTTEPSAYDAVARGMNIVKVLGNRLSSYKTGTILFFNSIDFYEATGVMYDQPSNRTVITISRNTVSQYDTQTLMYSVRPVYEGTTTAFTTLFNPILTQEVMVWRRVEGTVGQILVSPTGYTIDASGNVKVAEPLNPGEEISIFYTGYYMVQGGLRLQASYTNVIVPSTSNGLLGQNLLSDYYTFSPDTFYYRVESMTNFRNQYAAELQAQATATTPTGGPMTSNTASAPLYQKGTASIFYNEVHYANDDIVARITLKFYNDAVNYLEDALHAIDGRVVGDISGRFLFDGNINNPVRLLPSEVTNQIDDQLLVSPFPIRQAPLTSGTTQAIYLPGPYSRFFTTRRNLFATSAAMVASNQGGGSAITKFTFNNISSIPGSCFKRLPRAQIQFSYPAGATTFVVDTAVYATSDPLQRPSFVPQMRIIVEDPTHTGSSGYIQDSAHTTVVSVSAGPPQTITISAGASVTIPAGATIYMAPSDANTSLYSGDYPPAAGSNGAYQMLYRFGHDVDLNFGTGELLYKTRSFPFNHTISALTPPLNIIPLSFDIYPVQNGDIIEVDGVGVNATNTAPYEFPALTGGIYDDDGNQSTPIVGPTFDGELTAAGGGPLQDELAAYQTPSPGPVGPLLNSAIVTPPYVGTGSLDATKTIITDTGTYPVPHPKVNDLVRIYTGLNVPTDVNFHRISAVGTNTITVDHPFAFQDSSFSYTIAVSTLTTVGVTTALAGTLLTDTTASFGAEVPTPTQAGFTVTMTSGPNLGYRRQVASVTDATHLVLTNPFPSPTSLGAYRIDNPLDTYNGPTQQVISGALAAEIATVGTAQTTALFNFLNVVFTDVINSSAGTVYVANLLQIEDLTVDFIALEVGTTDYVYCPNGVEMGIYKIASVDDAHHITISGGPFVAATSIPYQIVSAFSVSFPTLSAIMGIITANQAYVTSTTSFQALWNAVVQVNIGGTIDASAFSYGILATDLTTRAGVVNTRVAAAKSNVTTIQSALSGTEKLYDKRYTWIDARLNLSTGLLVQETIAQTTRIAAQANILTQLLKLLAVQA